MFQPKPKTHKRSTGPILAKDILSPTNNKIDATINPIKNTESTRSHLSPSHGKALSSRLDHIKPRVSNMMPDAFNIANSPKVYWDDSKESSKGNSSFSKWHNNTQESEGKLPKRKVSGDPFWMDGRVKGAKKKSNQSSVQDLTMEDNRSNSKDVISQRAISRESKGNGSQSEIRKNLIYSVKVKIGLILE